MAAEHVSHVSAALVPTSGTVGEAPEWELRLLQERAAELESLQRFEEALVLYHRGRQRAPLNPAFRDGVRRAEQAVQGSIGEGAAPLFAAMPAMLPAMIEAQRGAARRARSAARRAHERLREAVRSMAFSEEGASGARRRAEDEDGDDEASMQIAVRDSGGRNISPAP